ncbi:MAG: type transport system permease protein [Myxococcales bacterium]|nr:type transport system permease protein [Myxococcales bacterium]
MLRLREIAREPGTLFWVFGFPVLLAAALGVAFSNQRRQPVVVGVLQPTSITVEQTLTAAGIEVQRLTEPQARERLRNGQVQLVVSGGAATSVQYRFDPARPEARLARAAVDQALQRAAGRVDPLAVQEQEIKEPGSRYIDFLVPGLIGMNIMSGSMWGLGWVIVNMRVRKVLKRLLATPMRRWQLLLSQMTARLLVIPFEVGALLIFARVTFGVRINGSMAALVTVVLIGALSFSGLAILVSSRAQNPETVTGLMNLVMLPMFMLSGVFFSSTRFPQALRPVVSLLPLTALNDALRAVLVDGSTLAAQGAPLLVLVGWGAIGWLVGLRVFRWS